MLMGQKTCKRATATCQSNLFVDHCKSLQPVKLRVVSLFLFCLLSQQLHSELVGIKECFLRRDWACTYSSCSSCNVKQSDECFPFCLVWDTKSRAPGEPQTALEAPGSVFPDVTGLKHWWGLSSCLFSSKPSVLRSRKILSCKGWFARGAERLTWVQFALVILFYCWWVFCFVYRKIIKSVWQATIFEHGFGLCYFPLFLITDLW